MSVDEGEVRLLATIIGWIVLVLGIGRQFGKDKERLDSQGKKIEEIDRLIKTPEGDIRFITYPAHDIITSNCKTQIAMEMNHIKQGNVDLKSSIDDLSKDMKIEMKAINEAVQKIAVHQALQSGRRITDHEVTGQ